MNTWKEPVGMLTQFNIWVINKRWLENGISLEGREISVLPLTYFSISLDCNFQLIWLSATLTVFMMERWFQCPVQSDPLRADLYWFELSLSGWMQLDLAWSGCIQFDPAGICCLCIDPHLRRSAELSWKELQWILPICFQSYLLFCLHCSQVFLFHFLLVPMPKL